MKRKLTLRQYVKRRNGVPLGAAGSLSNMLHRSFGAGSFSGFWRYWNPIWGYYLGTLFFSPLKKWFPTSIALIITFIISGAIHDLAVLAVTQKPSILITYWFFLMGICVAVSDQLGISYRGLSRLGRALVNITYISICFIIALVLKTV